MKLKHKIESLIIANACYTYNKYLTSQKCLQEVPK